MPLLVGVQNKNEETATFDKIHKKKKKNLS